jgi:hypothetical protein
MLNGMFQSILLFIYYFDMGSHFKSLVKPQSIILRNLRLDVPGEGKGNVLGLKGKESLR